MKQAGEQGIFTNLGYFVSQEPGQRSGKGAIASAKAAKRNRHRSHATHRGYVLFIKGVCGNSTLGRHIAQLASSAAIWKRDVASAVTHAVLTAECDIR